jgi:hypothetical protein
MRFGGLNLEASAGDALRLNFNKRRQNGIGIRGEFFLFFNPF